MVLQNQYIPTMVAEYWWKIRCLICKKNWIQKARIKLLIAVNAGLNGQDLAIIPDKTIGARFFMPIVFVKNRYSKNQPFSW